MKKTLKNWLLPVAMAASAVVGWSFFGPYPTNYITLSTSQDTDGGIRFLVEQLPDFDPNKTDNRYKIFLNTGDGYAFTETVNVPSSGSVTLTHKHYYATTQSRSIYAEATALDYDDKNPPPSLRANDSDVVPTQPSSLTNYSIAMSTWAKIEATRKPVSGDSVTYMVTYQNPSENGCDQPVHGNISLQYDHSKLEYLSTDKYFGESDFAHTTLSSGGKEVKWQYLSLDRGKQRNIFLKFLVKNDAQVNASLTPTPKLVFTHGSSNPLPESPCSNATVEETHTGSAQVAYSHDPNEKTADLKSICTNERFIAYTVRFQNEGSAAANTVVIFDELNALFGSAAPLLVGSSHPLHLAEFQYDPATNRRLTVRFGGIGKPGLNLRGLKEPGYGTAFQESATTGYVTFKVQLPLFDVPKHCSAMVNRAKIVFDCNPPIWTTTDISPYLCTSCDSCTTAPDTIVAMKSEMLPGLTGINPINFILRNQLQAQYNQFRWYPSVGLSAPTSLTTQFQSVQTNEYILIASKGSPSCRRRILRVPVTFPLCQLSIKTDPAGLAPPACAGQSTGTIRAWVEGGQGPYQWNNCQTTQNASDVMAPTEWRNLPPGEYYLGVTDANGCTAEATVTVQAAISPLRVDDNPNDCSANLLVSGGTPGYTYSWEYNGSQQNFFCSNLNLASKSGVRVTVTDAAGCSAVFSPRAANCTGGFGWTQALFVLFSALAALLGLRFLFSRKK